MKFKVDENLIFLGKCSFQFGYGFVKSNKDLFNRIDGIFAQADLIALGVIEALKELGVCVPEDISVVGYDDIKIGSFLRPRLTTIHQPREKYAVLACERLVELINKENHTQRMQMAVEPTLIVRESCGKGD